MVFVFLLSKDPETLDCALKNLETDKRFGQEQREELRELVYAMLKPVVINSTSPQNAGMREVFFKQARAQANLDVADIKMAANVPAKKLG